MGENGQEVPEGSKNKGDTEGCCGAGGQEAAYHGRKKEREEKEYRDLMNRLKRIEGQVRGVQKMLEEDAYCTDILVQVAAVNAALNSFGRILLSKHIRSCVADGIRQGDDGVIDELLVILQKLMK